MKTGKLRAGVYAAAIVGVAASAVAQEAAEPASNALPQPVELATTATQASYIGERKAVYNIVILGDILGTGLWAGMNRVVEEEDRITVTGRIQENSGLARPKLYNWPAAAEKILDTNDFDIVAVMLGANDARDISTEQGRLEFGSEAWKNAYGAAIRRLISAIRSKQAAIYWFGVPPMARDSYNEAMKIVADVERQVTAEEGVRYIDLQLLLAGPDGSYTDQGDDGSGEITRLRSRNGIKFITRGNDRLAAELMKLVRADMAVAEGQEPAPVVTSLPGQVLPPVVAGEVPLFVAQRPDGEDPQPVPQSRLPGPGFVQVATVNPSTRVDNANEASHSDFALEKAKVAPDTAAGRLFVEGVWPEAPARRFDRFAAPQKQDKAQ